MSVIFLKILNIGFVAGWMILAVLLLRLFLKKAPRWITCILWALVAIRLILPFSFESVLSLVPSAEVIPQDITTTQQPVINSGIRVVNNAVNPVITETFAPEVGDGVNPLQVIVPIASIVWIAGVIVMFGYVLVSYFVLKKQVSTAIPDKKSKLPVFLSDDIRTPFILGIIRPRIYLPSSLDRETRRYVVAHEKAHLKRHDHWWKPLGFLLLSVYWFHPLCWVAYILLCKDIEAACDEKVIRNKEKDYLAAYSQALLDCAVQRKQISACPLAFGENGVKNRVKGILNFKKPAFWIIIVAIICVIVASVCFLTNPQKKEKENTKISEGNSEETSEVVIAGNEKTKEIIPESGLNSTNGYFHNLYQIDEAGTLWASGYNDCGQLGQGTSDQDYHAIPVKVAENVIHVDYGINSTFAIYLTRDHKLYGFGSNYTNALLQYKDYDANRFYNPGSYVLGEQVLLMENVSYAECGRYDVVALKEDGTVWTWGTLATTADWHYVKNMNKDMLTAQSESEQEYLKEAYLTEPQMILDHTKTITGGFFNHAALKDDGTLWTWGYNATGNCGIKDSYIVFKPTKVADNVQKVWTEKLQNEVSEISEYGDSAYELMQNTLIQKTNGEYYICGIGFGKKQILPRYFEASNQENICTADFISISEADAAKVLGFVKNESKSGESVPDTKLSDWLSAVELPFGYSFSQFIDNCGYQGCFLILPRLYERDEESGIPIEWQYSGMLSRLSADNPQINITYKNGVPDLSGVPIPNHTSAEYIDVIGLERSNMQWPAIMVEESHGLYSHPEIEQMKNDGIDVESMNLTSDYWNFWFVKEGKEYYYVLSLSKEMFTKEEAIRIAKTVEIKE